MSDDEWDDEPVKEAPKVLMVGRVKQDYYPEKHHQLTLFEGELVYVFKKESEEGPGWWEGETRGIYGPFKPEFIVEVKP